MEYNLYYNKYLKYKNKYLTLQHNIQHNIQHGGDKKYKILIVVDVQNCFLEHFGTFGWQPKDIEGESEEDKKIRREGYVTAFKEKLNTFLKKAKNEYDIIVFTKDSHPIGHKSFIGDGGLYPPHCVDIKKGKICINSKYYTENISYSGKDKLEQDLKESETGKSLIKLDNETDIEKNIQYDIKLELSNKDIINYENKLTLNLQHLKNHIKTTFATDTFKTKISKENDAIIVRLNKGELCEFDAYSAFVYHIYYENGDKDLFTENYITYNTKSTGLIEFISYYYLNKFPNNCETFDLSNLEIDVCGLVTNICVVNTCIGGLKLCRELFGEKSPRFNLLNEYSLNLHLDVVSSTVDKLNKANFKINDDYDIIDNKTTDLKKNHIYVINQLAVDDYKL